MSSDAATTPGWQRARRIAGSVWTRVLVTSALLAAVASRVDWATVGHRLSHGHPLDFIVAVGLVAGSLVLGAYRWGCLLRAASVRLSTASLARAYAIATFSGTFLPATVGGDVTRTMLVVRRGPALMRVVVSVVVDRAGGLLGLVGMAWLALAFAPASVPRNAQAFLFWVTIALLLVSLVVLIGVLRGSRLIRSRLPDRIATPMSRARDLLRRYATDAPLLAIVTASSLLYQALIALQLVFLARALNITLPFATAAVALALVTVATLVPISIGGFGVREGTYVLLLGGASIGATDATLISVLSVAALFIASLPGAFMLARGGLAPALREVPR